MSTVRGKTSPTENYEEITYSPQTGWTRRSGINGPKFALKAMLNELAAQGRSFSYTCDQNPNATIRFEVPGQPDNGGPPSETPTLVWELLASVVEIDILDSDVQAVAALTKNEVTGIRQGLLSPDDADQPALVGTAETLYKLMQSGLRNIRVNIPTLKVSKLVSGSYPVKAALTNVGRIISPTTLSIQESIPGTILFNLPAFTPSTAKANLGFTYAWYKKFPSVQQSGGNKWNVSQEWEYGLWPTLIYGAAL